MTLARGDLLKKLLPIAVLSLISASIVVFLPPSNLIIIMLFIIFVSLTLGLAAKLLVSHKYAFITSAFIFVSLTMLALDLFDPINFLISISLLVGISILIK